MLLIINLNTYKIDYTIEYKIQLLNKSKKIINQVENFKKIGIDVRKKTSHKEKKLSPLLNKNKRKSDKALGKTLWVRRKNKSN